MPSYLTNLPVQAGGNILPSRFLTVDPTANNQVVQATGNQFLIGVAQVGPRNAPGLADAISGQSITDYAAVSGDQLQIFTAGDYAPVQYGGSVTAGDRLKSNGSGQAVTATSGTWYGGIALYSGSTGAILDVLLAYGREP